MSRSTLLVTLLVAGTTTGSLALAQGRTDAASPDILPPEPNIKRVVVASPRATLVTTVIPDDPGITNKLPIQSPERPLTIGDAANFAKDGNPIRIRHDRTVFVQLSRAAEGVWYDHAFGWLGTKVVVFARYWGLAVPDQLTPEQDSNPWRFVGRDGAAAIALGPAIGRAANPIGVPINFGRPGAYEVLARIVTYAYPVTSIHDPITRPPTSDELRMNGVVAYDDVRFKVRVMPRGAIAEVDPVPHRELDAIDLMPVQALPGILE